MASASTAKGRKTQFTTINLVPWYSGSTKLDVFPGGGGMAGMIWASAILGIAWVDVLCTITGGIVVEIEKKRKRRTTGGDNNNNERSPAARIKKRTRRRINQID